MRRSGLGAFAAVLIAGHALRASVALAAEPVKTLNAAPHPPSARVRPRVPQIPPDVKALGDRLSATASPAVKSWASQNAQAIAKGSGDPEALARAAVHARWSHVRTPGASDTLTFLATYEAVNSQQDTIKQQLDSKSEMGEMESLRLQMAMDRMSKMISTLSNLLRKISTTSDAITQNLK